MNKPDKYFKEIEKKLGSENKTEVLKTLKEIRTNGKAIITPLLFRVLNSKPGNEISDEIFNILNELKNKECVPYIIEAIKSGKSDSYMTRLIITCWQSGLDYSDHIKVFAEQFIKGDFQTALEAFTVIEEWIFESDPKTINTCKEYLIDNIKKVSDEKKPLYIELVKVVESHL